MIGGIRHFIWDTGAGFDIKTIDLLSWGSIVISAIAAVAVWAYALLGGGVAL
jgi:succinate dehydrogenase / fumarate reductase cytochrome b subunit